jgi:putative glutamine amidotransferase
MNERSEPIIGICAIKERARWAFWDQEAHLVADSYVSGLQRAGAIAILLPVDRRAPLRLLELIDGLVLIGGADIDPRVHLSRA